VATIHQARNGVVSLLYAYDLGSDSIDELKHELFEERKIRNKQRVFADKLFDGVMQNLKYIDDLIAEHLTDRTLEEIGKIEKAVLRVGVYEIRFTATDKPIIINEGLELVKDFGLDEGTKLINAVLDSIERK
jgi:N utilization substance protein B